MHLKSHLSKQIPPRTHTVELSKETIRRDAHRSSSLITLTQDTTLRFKLRTLAASLLASSLLVAAPAFALTVQPIHVLSSLGEPFRAELVISDIAGIKPDTIRASLANDDEFIQLGINKLGMTRHLQFSTKLSSPERGVITITSDKVLNDPYIEFVVHIGFGNNTRLQQVTALVDPPLTRVQTSTLDLPVERIQLAQSSGAAPAAPQAAPSAPILGTMTVTRGVITTPALNMPLKPSRRSPPPMDIPSAPLAPAAPAPKATTANTPAGNTLSASPAQASTPAPAPTPAPVPAPLQTPTPAPSALDNKPAAPSMATPPPPSEPAKPAANISRPAPVIQSTALIASPIAQPLMDTPTPVAPPPAQTPKPVAPHAPAPIAASAPEPAPMPSSPKDSSNAVSATPPADTPLTPSLSSPPPMESPAPAAEPTAATPATPVVPEKPIEPEAPAKPVDANADRAYTVRRHDSLWSIASRMQNTTHQSIPVIMQSIKQLNKSAFIAGNANQIRSGAVLIMPSDQPEVISAPPANQPVHIENEDLDHNKAPTLKQPIAPISSNKETFTSRGRLPDAKMTLIAPTDQGSTQGAATTGQGAADDKKLNQLNLQISASRQKNLTLGQEVGQLEAQIKANDQKLALQNARLAELMQRLKNRKEAAPKTVKRIATS